MLNNLVDIERESGVSKDGGQNSKKIEDNVDMCAGRVCWLMQNG